MTVPAPDDTASDRPPAPVTAVSHLQLVVGDVAASRDWWVQVLGMATLFEDESGDVVALRHRPSKVVIVLSARAAGSPGPGDRLDHVAFAVPDRATLDTWVDHLDRLGIEHPGVVDELGNHSLQLVDPDGINVELVAPPDRP